MKNIKPSLRKLSSLMRGDWGFPIALTIILLLLTAFKISGSSAGFYQDLFYGTEKDSSLIEGHPESVRSDEFLVNTQMTLAQSKLGYPKLDKDIGNGEDMSLVLDVPYKSWSEFFKPHNWVFFVLPVEYAFAFKWWLLAYLLLISCYFFVLSLLPGRRLLAAGISVSLLFSAFVQWWYQYVTLGPLYYSLFIGAAFVHFLRQKSLRRKLLLAAAMTYLLICFVLVFYPPFQIACAVVLAGFVIGELITYYKDSGLKKLLIVLRWLASCLVISVAVIGVFVLTEHNVFKIVDNTVYPGQRITKSGGFNVEHLLSGNLGYQFSSKTKAADYRLFNQPTNQSESSNFILLTPFLFLPSLFLLYKDKKKSRKTDWPLVIVNVVFVIFMLELFVPAFTPISKLFLFEKVPLQRELIGLGLLNVIQLVLVIRNLLKRKPFSNNIAIPYALVVFLIEIGLGLYAHHHYPGFISKYRVLAFSLPVPVIIYCLLRKYFRVGVLGFLLFSLLISVSINPLYRGLGILKNNPVDTAIQQIAKKSPKSRWAAEGLLLENFPEINGAQSLSGVYYYPQNNIWKSIGSGSESYIYNRYAHVNFQFLQQEITITPSYSC